MAKKVAVIAVNPVNGAGLFQYLEAFYENGIPYTVFAVSDKKEIKTNSGITIFTDDVIASLKNKVDDYDALVFACGDAVPKFSENASSPYNQDMMKVLSIFGNKGKMMIGHCAAGMMFEFAGVAGGKNLAVHPLAKPAVRKGNATDGKYEVDNNFYTAQTENTISEMMEKLIISLK